MKWITRENAAVDRIACPWLIRRFVDPDAEFLYVAADRVQEIAAEQGATPFDVAGAKLGHVDGRCSFESIILEYGLTLMRQKFTLLGPTERRSLRTAA